MDENKLAKSVQHVMVVFLFLFIALITYIAYFQVFRGPKIAEDSGNVRVLAAKNEVIRGTIYDRNGTPLTETTKINDLTQDRKYLYGDLLVHPLGYYDEVYGMSGLESEYDDELSSNSFIGNSYRAFLSSIDFAGLVSDIKDDLINRINIITEKINEINSISTRLVEEYIVKLEKRVNELLKPNIIDEARLAQEIVIYSDKCSVEEELTRLRSHISQFLGLLEKNDSNGKRIDFLIQEMNRETNTIGSKANNLEITNYVVDIKTELENVREQIQNIE